MATLSGAVGFVEVSETSALVLFHTTGDFPTGALLWIDAGQAVTPTEMVKRSMWLALVNKSLQHHYSLSLTTDDVGNVTAVSLTDTVEDVSRSALPRSSSARAELVERLLAAAA